jgi:hypothetical protein
MWKILDCVIAQPEEPGKGLFKQSYSRDRHTDIRGQSSQFNVEDPDVTSQATEIYNAGACNAPRPDWFPPTTAEPDHRQLRQSEEKLAPNMTNAQVSQSLPPQPSQQGDVVGGGENPPLLFDWAGGVSGTAGFYDPNISYPWQDSLSWALDFGNL